MRRSFALVPVMIALAAPASQAHGADRGEAKLTLGGKSISIDYGRPSLAGRDMLAQLQAGQAWRMGADAATTLTTEAALAFGSAALPAGEYVLTAKRSAEGKWTLIASKGGAAVAEIPMSEEKLGQPVEVFTIELTGDGNKGRFTLKWGASALSAPFTAQ